MKLILILIFLFAPLNASAKDKQIGDVTKLPIPRFASLRADEIFARTGPGTRYPIKWIYQIKNLPVAIIQEFETWRKIRDIDGEEAWVHQSMLTGKRTAMIKREALETIYKKPSDDSSPVAKIEPRALLNLEACELNWCEVSASSLSGWISYEKLWGVYEGEQIQ